MPREPQLSDLPDARLRRILTIAAAGGHHLLVTSRSAVDLSCVAAILVGLLPDLDATAARDVGDLHWQAGQPRTARMCARPPGISAAHPLPAGTLWQPGPASLAHHGVLHRRNAETLDAEEVRTLVRVLDERRVLVRAGTQVAIYPAGTQIVLTGSATLPDRALGLADRLDIHAHVPACCPSPPVDGAEQSGTVIAERVAQARAAATARWSPGTEVVNADIDATRLRQALGLLPTSAGRYLRSHADAARLSTRGWIRVLRLAWTIADLDGRARPDCRAFDEAIGLRVTAGGWP